MDEKILIRSEKIDIKEETLSKNTAIVFIAAYIFFFFVFLFSNGFHPMMLVAPLIPTAMVFIPLFALYLFILLISKNQLVVSDKRISGNSAFGKRIDLPIDSVSSVSTIKLIKGLSIATSSGRVSFWAIGNRDDIYNVISDLIINRQSKNSTNYSEVKTSTPSDYTEELRKLNNLLESGIITQEEFDAKKKQLLGL